MPAPSSRPSLYGVLAPIALLGSSPAIGQPARSSADLIAGLLPEVVNLSLTKYEKTHAAPGNMASQPAVKEEKTQASCFIIDPPGLIVTNRHAVADAADIMVILNDGTHLRGTVLAAATQSDIALLKVNAERPLPSVRFGDSDELRPGDPVYVIGNPFGFGSTVTSGIVSALDRQMPESGAGSFIQIAVSTPHDATDRASSCFWFRTNRDCTGYRCRSRLELTFRGGHRQWQV